jgi:hypothetical protein
MPHILDRSKQVLDRIYHDGTGVIFKHPDEVGSATLQLSHKDWTAMGEPTQITVTIEPGDTLNGAASTDDGIGGKKVRD